MARNRLDDFINNIKETTKKDELNDEVVENECSLNRQINEANKIILTNNFHEWTNTVDHIITGETKKLKSLKVEKPNMNLNKWEKYKRMQMEGDDVMSKIYQIMYPDLTEPKEESGESRFESELLRLQNRKTLRAQHEQMIAKCRNNKKIKAKNYHRHSRKRDLKEFLRTDADKKNTNEIKERLDKMRAEERISLKHKTGGKFAKLNKLKAKYDEKARAALDEMHSKGQELTRKNEDDDEDTADELSEGNEMDDSDDTLDNDSNVEEMAVDNSNDVASIHQSLLPLANEEPEKETVTKLFNVLSTDTPMIFNQDEHIMDDSNEILTCSDRESFKNAIYEVYQEDNDLMAQFEQEKADLVKGETPQDVCTYVPGWGDWTGPGLEGRDKKRKERSMVKAPTVNRKDTKKPRLWIKQGVHEGLKKHLVKTIPYPYNTVQQYELSRQQLVSSAFTMESVSRKLCSQRINTKPGKFIQPLSKAEQKNEYL